MTSRARSVAAGKRDQRAVAKVFWSGRSQAIRLPKEFRVEERELLIARRGKSLVLEPRQQALDAHGWPKSFFDLFGALPDDFDLGSRDARPERRSPLEDD
jgi:antitoxin VapB